MACSSMIGVLSYLLLHNPHRIEVIDGRAALAWRDSNLDFAALGPLGWFRLSFKRLPDRFGNIHKCLFHSLTLRPAARQTRCADGDSFIRRVKRNFKLHRDSKGHSIDAVHVRPTGDQ